MRTLNTHLVSSNPAHLGNTLAVPDQQRPVVIATSGSFVSGSVQLLPYPNGTLSGSFRTPGVDISHLYGFSVSAVFSGSLTGSCQLNAACSPGYAKNPPDFASQTSGQGQVFLDQGIVDWNYIPGTLTQVTCSSGGSSQIITWNLSQQFYKWVQFEFDIGPGTAVTQNTGSVDVFVNGKGNRD
jgi:hypothetical protein